MKLICFNKYYILVVHTHTRARSRICKSKRKIPSQHLINTLKKKLVSTIKKIHSSIHPGFHNRAKGSHLGSTLMWSSFLELGPHNTNPPSPKPCHSLLLCAFINPSVKLTFVFFWKSFICFLRKLLYWFIPLFLRPLSLSILNTLATIHPLNKPVMIHYFYMTNSP